ncbi:MAG: hypothetical protein K2O55_02915 [Alistipes sp.]|nr:hypothetical protein [Alistipes sp.]
MASYGQDFDTLTAHSIVGTGSTGSDGAAHPRCSRVAGAHDGLDRRIGGKRCHTQKVFHMQGSEETLGRIAERLLSADLLKIKFLLTC